MNTCSRKLLVTLALLAGCGPAERPAPDDVAQASVRTETVRGPVTLIVEVSPGTVRLSDEPVLTVTIRSEPDVMVTAPPFGQSVGEFLIRGFQEPVVPAEDGMQILRQVYTLEPTRTGTLTIAPITVTFQDQRSAKDDQNNTVESEALSVEVTTVVGDAAPSLNDLKPSAPPVELPSDGPPAIIWLIAGLLVIAGGLVIVVVRRRQQQRLRKPPLTPEQLAQLELDQIIGRRLAESDLKAFYTEVTGVVRRYIERSTGVRAPEQTTEEFLHEILAVSVFADDEQRQLRQFLESADLVKFAGHRPAPEDVDASLTRAREFTQRNPITAAEAAE